jgi:hypothetical protein
MFICKKNIYQYLHTSCSQQLKLKHDSVKKCPVFSTKRMVCHPTSIRPGKHAAITLGVSGNGVRANFLV